MLTKPNRLAFRFVNLIHLRSAMQVIQLPRTIRVMWNKKTKYHNIKTATGFDSKKEERRWNELCLLQKAGKISDLEKQKRFDIVVNGHKICFYKADFVYQENGKQVTEDAKGMKTPVYNLKKKLLFATHGIVIREV